MKAGIEHRVSSLPPVGSVSRKGKALLFVAGLFFSLFAHVVMVLAVVYGTGWGNNSAANRVVALDVVFVPADIAQKQTDKSAKEVQQPEKDNSVVSNQSTGHHKDNNNKKVAKSGNQESSVIPVLKDISARVQTSPVYPSSAKRRGYEGTVIVRALVDGNGKIINARIISSSGYDSLDDSAVSAVRQWVFDVPISHDKVWVEVPIRFILSKS